MKKGKHWGKLTAQPGTEYQQRSSGADGRSESATRSNMLEGRSKTEYDQKSSPGTSGKGTPSGKFLGPTKGNSDFPPDHTKGTPMGKYAGA